MTLLQDRGEEDREEPASRVADPDPSPFEPVGVVPRYDPPKATVHPDTTRRWVRRMLPIVLAHRRLLTVSAISALIAMVTLVAVPAVTRNAIDNALVDKTSALEPFVITLVVLAVVRAVFTYGYRYGLYRMAYLIEYDLRAIIYEHLTRLSFSFYDRVQSGQVISRANSDIRSVQMFLAFAPLMSMSVLMFILAFGFMLTINVPLTLVAVAPLPFVYLLGVRLRNIVFPLSWIIQSRVADVATIVDENVSGVRVVKSFAAEEQQIAVLSRAGQRLQWANVTQNDARAKLAPFLENLPRVGLVGVLLYGGWLAIEGQVTIGTLVAFNAYVLMMQTPFRMLGFFLMLAQRAAASAERIYEVLDEAPAVVDWPGAYDLVDPESGSVAAHGAEVAFDQVTFGYGDGPAILDGFSLHLDPGDTVAIVGRTGSGKSTATRLLARFYDVDDGVVRVDGHDIRDLTLVSLRSQVGIVLDEPFLFSESLRDNIAYGRPDATDEEIRAAAVAAQADGFIEALPEGYDTVIGERGYDLSGGQRQRVAIARTLLVNPRILVLDDATSAIDVHVEEAIHDALVTLMEGRTTVVIAHRLSTIRLAERVVLLENGRVAASGTHAELMATEPRYAEVLAHFDDEDGD